MRFHPEATLVFFLLPPVGRSVPERAIGLMWFHHLLALTPPGAVGASVGTCESPAPETFHLKSHKRLRARNDFESHSGNACNEVNRLIQSAAGPQPETGAAGVDESKEVVAGGQP